MNLQLFFSRMMLLLLMILDRACSFHLQQQRVIVTTTTRFETSSSSTLRLAAPDNHHNNNNNKEEGSLPIGSSLEDVLTRARQRKAVMPWYRVQAFFDAPLFQISTQSLAVVCTRGEAALLVVAFAIDAKGFALGLVIGKLTAAPFRDAFGIPATVQIVITPLWPVCWAIGLDILLR